MILKINTDNCEVIESDTVLKEGVNVVGEIRVLMTEDNYSVSCKDEEQ